MQTKMPSVIAIILTIILLILIGVLVTFMSLVAMNGFSESDGGPALLALVITEIFAIILSAILAGKLTKLFITKYNWNSFLAVLLSLGGSTIFGTVMYGIGFVVAIVVAQILSSR